MGFFNRVMFMGASENVFVCNSRLVFGSALRLGWNCLLGMTWWVIGSISYLIQWAMGSMGYFGVGNHAGLRL